MLRALNIRLAPLATLKPILAASVTESNTVRRIIGIDLTRTLNLNVIDSVIKKSNGEELSWVAAMVARAVSYLKAHNPAAAVEEINATLPKIEDKALKHMAIGIRLRAFNDLLDLKEAALSVAGGATETEVSHVRTQAQKDYDALKVLSPNCWLVKLACTEYSLYLGKSKEAYDGFGKVEEEIKCYLKKFHKLANDVATSANVNPYLLLGFILQRAFILRGVNLEKTEKIVSEGMVAIADDPEAKGALGRFKKELGLQLTDEEVMEIARVLEMANVGHHFHNFFPRWSEYEDWPSAAAQEARQLLRDAEGATKVFITVQALDQIRSSVPFEPFYAPVERLQKVLNSPPKGRSIVQAIRAELGRGSEAILPKEEDAYTAVLKSINTAGTSPDTAGALSYAEQQMKISKTLAQQLLYRTQVQKAVALIELNRMHEAVEVITPVIKSDAYIYMWRALLARSRAYKALGLITPADKDMKALQELKKSLTEHPPYDMI